MFLLLIVLWLMPVAQPLETGAAEPVAAAATSLCQEDLHELLNNVIVQCGQQGGSTVALITTMNKLLEQQRLLVQQFEEKEPEEKEAVRIKVRLLDIVIILGVALGIYYFWEYKWYQPLLDFFNEVHEWLTELWEKLWNMLPRWSEPMSPSETPKDSSKPPGKKPDKLHVPPTESPEDADVSSVDDLAQDNMNAHDVKKDKQEKENNKHNAHGHHEHGGGLGFGDLLSGFAGSGTLACSLDSLMQACARNNVEQELLLEFFKTVEPVAELGQHGSNVPNNATRVTRATRSAQQVLSSEDALYKACESNIAGEPHVNVGISLVLNFIEYTELDKRLIRLVKRQLGQAEGRGIDIFEITQEKLDRQRNPHYQRSEIDCPYVLYDLVEEQLDEAREMGIEFERD